MTRCRARRRRCRSPWAPKRGTCGSTATTAAGDRWTPAPSTSSTIGDYRLGMDRGSLSPDGTRLAIGQADGVVVIDLTTAESRTYPVDGLGEVWTGRATYWTPDGAAVLLGRSWAALGEPLDVHQRLAHRGRRRVSSPGLEFDPAYAAPARGRFCGRRPLERDRRPPRHVWSRFDPRACDLAGRARRVRRPRPTGGTRTAVGGAASAHHVSVGSFLGRERSCRPRDRASRSRCSRSWHGEQRRRRPGDRLGDRLIVLFSMPDPDAPQTAAGVVAWDVETGELWRGATQCSKSRSSPWPNHDLTH